MWIMYTSNRCVKKNMMKDPTDFKEIKNYMLQYDTFEEISKFFRIPQFSELDTSWT
jgi:hypothetical protein